jgi:hypothetical protein
VYVDAKEVGPVLAGFIARRPCVGFASTCTYVDDWVLSPRALAVKAPASTLPLPPRDVSLERLFSSSDTTKPVSTGDAVTLMADRFKAAHLGKLAFENEPFEITRVVVGKPEQCPDPASLPMEREAYLRACLAKAATQDRSGGSGSGEASPGSGAPQ